MIWMDAVPFFDFNIYSSLLLCPFVTGLLFTALCSLRYRRQGELPMLFLGMLLLLLTMRLSFWMLGFAGWYDRHNWQTTLMFYFPFNILPLLGPCLYFYFLSLTNREFRIRRELWPHFVIPVLFFLLCTSKFVIDFAAYRPFPKNEYFQFGTRGPWAELDKSAAVYIVAYLSLFYYFLVILRSLKAYEKYLLAHFAETESIDLRWLKHLIWFTIFAIINFCVFYLLNLVIRLDYVLNWYPYLVLGALIYDIGVNGYYHSGGLFRLLHFTRKEAAADVTSALHELDSWKENLEELMSLEKAFLDPSVNLTVLAGKLGTNTSVLSRTINEGFGLNFNDYINGLRVQEVIERLEQRDYEKYSLMGIAWDCGFNSKTTFNRSFKKVTGKTPSDYIDQLEGSDHDLKR